MQVKVEQYHAVIAVADLDRAVQFYSTKLGFSHMGVPGSSSRRLLALFG